MPSTNLFQNKSPIEKSRQHIMNKGHSEEVYGPFDENHSTHKSVIVRNKNPESSNINAHSLEPSHGMSTEKLEMIQ